MKRQLKECLLLYKTHRLTSSISLEQFRISYLCGFLLIICLREGCNVLINAARRFRVKTYLQFVKVERRYLSMKHMNVFLFNENQHHLFSFYSRDRLTHIVNNITKLPAIWCMALDGFQRWQGPDISQTVRSRLSGRKQHGKSCLLKFARQFLVDYLKISQTRIESGRGQPTPSPPTSWALCGGSLHTAR